MSGCDLLDEVSDYTSAPIDFSVDLPSGGQVLALPFPNQDQINQAAELAGVVGQTVRVPIEQYQSPIDLLAAADDTTRTMLEDNKNKIEKIEILKITAHVSENGFPVPIEPVQLLIGGASDTMQTAQIAATIPGVGANATGEFTTDDPSEGSAASIVSANLKSFRIGVGTKTAVSIQAGNVPAGAEMKLRMTLQMRLTVNPLK